MRKNGTDRQTIAESRLATEESPSALMATFAPWLWATIECVASGTAQKERTDQIAILQQL